MAPARCEVQDGLLDLLLQLKGAFGDVGPSLNSNNAIWRFEKVRMLPLLTKPWPELVEAGRRAGVTQAPHITDGMHVDLRLLRGAEAL